MSVFVVTGANGFIGHNVLAHLLSVAPQSLGLSAAKPFRFSQFGSHAAQSNVISVIGSDLPESQNRSIAYRFSASARYRYVDHKELFQVLRSLPERPVAFIHNGACSSTTETDRELFKRLNIDFSKAVWDYCTAEQVPLLYASSASVYGDGSFGFSDRKEDARRYAPLNLYAQSKQDFDLWVLQQTKTPPVWFGLRYFNVFGPFESHKKGQASMVFHGYHQIKQTGAMRLFESNNSRYQAGEQQRDFVAVQDIVDITMELFQLYQQGQFKNLPERGAFLNIGRGLAESWNTLAQHIFATLSLPARIEYIPIPPHIAGQYQNFTCADLSTLRAIGVTHAFSSLRQGIENYVHRFLVPGE